MLLLTSCPKASTARFLWSICEALHRFFNVWLKTESEAAVEFLVEFVVDVINQNRKLYPPHIILRNVLRSSARLVRGVDAYIHELVGVILGTLTAELPHTGLAFLPEVLRSAAKTTNLHHLVGMILSTLTGELPHAIWVFVHEVLSLAARTTNLHHLVGAILGTLTGALPHVGWVFARMHGLFNFLSIFIWWG